MAEWKTIKDFPDYFISNDGEIKSIKNGKERFLKPYKGSTGHMKLTLFDDKHNRNYKLLHRLLAETFIPNPDNLPFVRHLNDIPDDNRLENLAWGTVGDNVKDAIRNGRKFIFHKQKKRVIAIKDGKSKEFESYSEAARQLNMKESDVHMVVSGKRNSAYGYKFVSPKPRHTGKPKPWNSK